MPTTRKASGTEPEDTPLTHHAMSNLLDKYIKPIDEKINKMCASLYKMEQKIQTMEKEQQDQAQALSFIGDDLDGLKKNVGTLQNELKSTTEKAEEMVQIKAGLERMEFDRRAKCVEINGIPMGKGEQLMEALKSMATKLQLPISTDDVDTVYRIKSTKRVVIRFQHAHKRHTFYQKFKKSSVVQRDIGFKSDERLYISEVLSAGQYELFYKARAFRKENNYAYVWTRNQKIYLRKTTDSQPIEIISADTLKNLTK